jgi:hypothetical protein
MIGGIPDGSGKVPDDRGGYLGIIQRGKDVADMEYITTTEPKLSSRSLAESYKAPLAQLNTQHTTTLKATHTHTQPASHTHIHTYTQTHSHTHTHTHTTHTNTHTHTH